MAWVANKQRVRRRNGSAEWNNNRVKEDETHPWVHEDEVHLHEGEHHLENGVGTPQHRVAGRVHRDLKPGAKLQAVVDHGAQSKSWNQIAIEVF